MHLFRSTLILVLILIVQCTYGQSSSVLQKRKAAINKEIEILKSTRNKIENRKKLSLTQIKLLDAQIKLREEKIGTINTEIRELDNKIYTNTSEVRTLQSNLSELKIQYSKMILFAFRNQGAYNKLMFIFASRDFNQAYMRLKYLQQIGQLRKRQAKNIVNTQVTLEKEISKLDRNKKDKSTLLLDQVTEKQTLGNDKNQQSKILKTLSSQQKTLQQQLAKKQKEAKDLNNAIQAAIRKEILSEQRKQAERARLEEKARLAKLADLKAKAGTATEAAPSPVSKPAAKGSSVLASSPKDAMLSSSFMGSRGRLQKPVQGVVTQGFGQHKYNSNVTVFNTGINIKTAEGANVSAVYNGKVSKVVFLVNSYTVIIRHGEYFSIYSKLRNVSVSSGQEVKTRQSIGSVATDASDGITEMQFQIWKGSSPVNPAGWISD